MIPVQVGTRIVDSVDSCRAQVMSRGVNVRTIRDRKTKSIVRLIIISREAGNGRANEPSVGGNSRKATYVENLFTDHEPAEKLRTSDGSYVPRTAGRPIGGRPFIHALKPSSVFSQSSGRERRGGVAPTTNSRAVRPGFKGGK